MTRIAGQQREIALEGIEMGFCYPEIWEGAAAEPERQEKGASYQQQVDSK